MIKMIIQMDKDIIHNSSLYSDEKITNTLDHIFSETGMEKKETDNGTEYCGRGVPSDFARFGKIMLGLKKQSWFMDNVTVWLLCNSDDSDNPEEFDEENLLEHYRNSVVA